MKEARAWSTPRVAKEEWWWTVVPARRGGTAGGRGLLYWATRALFSAGGGITRTKISSTMVPGFPPSVAVGKSRRAAVTGHARIRK